MEEGVPLLFPPLPGDREGVEEKESKGDGVVFPGGDPLAVVEEEGE